MDNPNNTEFMNDPMGFLDDHLINNQYPADAIFDRNIAGAVNFIGTVLDYLQQLPELFFDIVQKNVHGQENYFIRYAIKYLIDQNAIPPAILEPYRRYVRQLPAASDNPIRAYYFPYKVGGVASVDDLGFVDIPKQAGGGDPVFAFTGAFNGCHIVVTDYPKVRRRNTHYRVYHYQSPSNNTLFLPVKWGGQGQSFPGRVRHWLTWNDYGNPDDPYESGASNFLYFHDGSWWVCTQPFRMNMDYHRVDPPQVAGRDPFEREIRQNALFSPFLQRG